MIVEIKQSTCWRRTYRDFNDSSSLKVICEPAVTFDETDTVLDKINVSNKIGVFGDYCIISEALPCFVKSSVFSANNYIFDFTIKRKQVLIYSIIINRGNNEMKRFLTALTWAASLFSCLDLSMVTADSSIGDIVLSLSAFGTMIILIVIQILHAVKRKDNILGTVLSSIMPFLLFSFLLLRNYVNFGYGDTLGILGYYEPLGILSMVGMSRTIAFIGLCISYAVFCATVLFRYSLVEKMSDRFKKSIIITAAIFGVIIEVIGINVYFAGHRLSGLFILSVIVYILLYFLLNIISRKRYLKNVKK